MNVNQRLQSAAERRAQIDDARRVSICERAQRQLEQSTMRNIIHGGGNDFIPTPRMTTSASFGSGIRGGEQQQQPFLPGHSTNSSLAFGSTQPRNIDLTRPLVTPLPARPKSEIFPSGPLPFELLSSPKMATTSTGSHGITQTDSSPMYAKDDSNYRSKRVTASAASTAAVDMTPQCLAPLQAQPVAEPVIMAKQQQSLQAPLFSASSFMRAARRHDPELIPAKQRYLFREYGAPSSSSSSGTSWGGFRKENSIMTCSMTSTKSFQSKHPITGGTSS
ncbi:endopeptidase, partial [Euroglyphus maynei]